MPPGPQALIDRGDFDAFAARQRRRFKIAWMTVVGAAVASFFVLGALWSYAAGLLVALLIPLASYDLLKRWNRASWLRRFPQLEHLGHDWRPDPKAASQHQLG